jgi:hypothetical protein
MFKKLLVKLHYFDKKNRTDYEAVAVFQTINLT